MPPYLPGEITDHIIGSVSVWEKSTLCNCSLVCHAWLPASRHRLFAKLTIGHEVTYELLVDRVLRSEEMRPYLATTREITLINLPHLRQGGDPLHPQHFVTPLSAFLHTFYGSLPCLEKLSLRWFIFRCSVDSLLFTSLSNLRCLRLEFMNCNIPSFNALRRSITALRALEELDIWDATTKSRVGKPWVSSSKYAPGPQLRMFKLVGPQDEHVPGDLVDVLMHWLSNHTSLKELHLSIAMRRELSVTVGSPFGPGLMAFFQSGAASSVSSLSMDIMEGRYNPISYFTSLSSLTLSSDIDLCISSLWAEACAMLNDLRSPIRYLRFTEVLYHEPQTPCPAHSDFCFCLGPGGGIAELDAVLSRDVFRDLIRVEFHLRRWAYFGPYPPTAGLDDVPRPRIERSELLDRTKESLPQLFAAGVVLVAFTESWTLCEPDNANAREEGPPWKLDSVLT